MHNKIFLTNRKTTALVNMYKAGFIKVLDIEVLYTSGSQNEVSNA